MATIQHRICIAAAAEVVYDALTIADQLSAWWTPNATVLLQENSIARFPFGTEYYKEMQIDVLGASKMVQWTCIAGASEWVGTKISFGLVYNDKATLLKSYPEMHDQLRQASAEHGTILIFNHSNWRDDSPMFAECSYTWALFLRSLKSFCETGIGRPWPNQHRIN